MHLLLLAAAFTIITAAATLIPFAEGGDDKRG